MIRRLVRFVMGCAVCKTHRGLHAPYCYEYKRWKPMRRG